MKYISAEEGGSITYRSRLAEARAAEANCRQARRLIHSEPDKEGSFGPPDKATHYNSRWNWKASEDEISNSRLQHF